VRGLPGHGRERQGRPAGDPARRHPRRGRLPAAGPAGRPGQGQGPGLHRPARRGGGGAGARAGRRVVPDAEVYETRWPWRASSPAARRWRWPPPRGRSTRAWTCRCARAWPGEPAVRRAVRHRGPGTGMRSFLENGPGKATFAGR
jgi:hypothetical protein